jgi:hypothetical protein
MQVPLTYRVLVSNIQFIDKYSNSTQHFAGNEDSSHVNQPWNGNLYINKILQVILFDAQVWEELL